MVARASEKQEDEVEEVSLDGRLAVSNISLINH